MISRSWNYKFVALIVVAACLTSYVNCLLDVDRVHIEVSKTILREGDTYNVTCWFENLEVLQKLCVNIQNLTIDRPFNSSIITNVLNATTAFATFTSEVAKEKMCNRPSCICNGSILQTSDFMIGKRLNITDFDCIFLDDDIVPSLKCSFTTPPKTMDVDHTTRFSLEHLNYPEMQTQHCSITAIRTVCSIPPVNGFRFAKQHAFRLIMEDRLGKQSNNFTLDKAELIIMHNPGTNLTLVNRTSSSICLQWINNQKDNHSGFKVNWDVQLQPPCNGTCNWNIVKVHNPNGQNEGICFWGLPYPYHNYDLTLRCRYNDSRAHWSEPLIHHFSTDSTIPSRPPVVWPGGYHLDPDNHMRVYWQQLDHLEYNGPNFSYNVNVENSTAQVKNDDIHVEPNMAIIKNLNTRGRYTITINSQNINGSSSNSSLVIEMCEQRMPKHVIIPDEKKAKLTWDPPEQQDDLQGYTLYWCILNQTDRTECSNTEKLYSKLVNKFKTIYEDEMIMHALTKWAVSANYGNTTNTGGMLWMKGNDKMVKTIYDYTPETIVALLVLGSIICFYIIFLKCKTCAAIDISLPDGIDKLYNDKQSSTHPAQTHVFAKVIAEEVPLTFEGHIKPLNDSLISIIEPKEMSSIGTDTDSKIVQQPKISSIQMHTYSLRNPKEMTLGFEGHKKPLNVSSASVNEPFEMTAVDTTIMPLIITTPDATSPNVTVRPAYSSTDNVILQSLTPSKIAKHDLAFSASGYIRMESVQTPKIPKTSKAPKTLEYVTPPTIYR